MAKVDFIKYWRGKERVLSKAKLLTIEDRQEANHLPIFGSSHETYSVSSNTSDFVCTNHEITFSMASDPTCHTATEFYDSGCEYNNRESTPSSTSSKDTKNLDNTFYLVHDGKIYDYKPKNDSVRW